MLACVNEDECFYLIDRAKKQPISKVKWSSPANSYNYEVFCIPGFDSKKLPFIILRDDFMIRLFNVNTQKIWSIKEAPYGSKFGKIYKTMDIIINDTEFEAIYLVSDERDEQQVTHINRVVFTEAFLQTLRSMVAIWERLLDWLGSQHFTITNLFGTSHPLVGAIWPTRMECLKVGGL